MTRRRRTPGKWAMIIGIIALVWLAQESRFYFPKRIQPPEGVNPKVVEMKTTSYCHCRRCCSYRWLLFVPYQKRGPLSFRIKHVGITSSGTMTRPGTIAADTSIYPYGTIMYIHGYGYGRVEDTGGAVKGQHIDLYRPNHWFARKWGVRSKYVKVWLPPQQTPKDIPNEIDDGIPEPKTKTSESEEEIGKTEISCLGSTNVLYNPQTNGGI